MEIQQLKHLLAAVKHGNLQKAADSSYISQSGLSRSIKSLEDRLGVPLLVRSPRGVEPTEYGRSVLRRANVILNEVRRGMDEVRAIEQARIGDVAIGITQNYVSYFAPELLAELSTDRPDLRISVVSDGFIELLKLVRTEAVDFAFGLIGPVHSDDDVVIEPLCAHRSRIIGRRDHPLARQNEVSLEELAKARWVMLSSGSVQRSFTSFFERRGLPIPAQVIKTNSTMLIRRLLTQMDLLTILPEDVVRWEVGRGDFVVIQNDAMAIQSRIGLVFRSGGLLTPQAEYVLNRFRVKACEERTAPVDGAAGAPARDADEQRLAIRP